MPTGSRSRRSPGPVSVLRVRPRPHLEGATMSLGDRPLGEVKLLTVAEVAAILRLSKMTVYRMVNSGALPALKVGRSVRVPEHVVDEYLRRAFVDTA